MVDAIRVCIKSVMGMWLMPSGYVQGAIWVCEKMKKVMAGEGKGLHKRL